MPRLPFKNCFLLSQVLLALTAGQSAWAQVGPQAPSPVKEEATPLPDFFNIPIWGLRVGGSASIRPPRNDTWQYFRAGRAILKISPRYLEYGTKYPGDLFAPDTVILQNVGSESLTVDGVKAPHQYSPSDDCVGAVLPPLGSCIFTVQFTPRDIRTAVGYVDIPFHSGENKSVGSLLVTGNVVMPPDGGPSGELSGDVDDGTGNYVLEFPPPVYLGDGPKFRTFNLTSSGNKDLRITSIGVTEGDMFYAPSHTCPSVLKAGESCNITVQLNPLAVGKITGQLTVRSSAYNDSDVKVTLLAEVEEWVAKLAYPEVVDFEVIDTGSTYTRTIEVQNTGNLPVTGVKFTPKAPFTVSNNECPAEIKPFTNGCKVTFSVRNNAVAELERTASVTANNLTHPGPDIKLLADAQLRQGTFTPTSFEFGLRDMAKLSPSMNITFTNTGSHGVIPFFGALSSPAEKDPAFGTPFKRLNDWVYIDEGTCASNVAAGGTCRARIAVSPSANMGLSHTFTGYPAKGMSARGVNMRVTATGTKQSFIYNPTLIDLGVVNGLQTIEGVITVENTSLDATTLTGFGTTLVQPSAGRGTITLSGGTCASTLTAAAKTCEIRFRFTGASLAKPETQESNDGRILFRYTGADTNYTSVPVNFLLQGSEASVALKDSSGITHDVGTFPVGIKQEALSKVSLTVTNPGPAAIQLHDISYPDLNRYGLPLLNDSSVEGGCAFGQPMAAGTSCQILLSPSPSPQLPGGRHTTKVNVNTLVNGVSTPINAQPFEISGDLTPMSLNMQEVYEFDHPELTSKKYTVNYGVTHGGSVYANRRDTMYGVSAHYPGDYQWAYSTGCNAVQVFTEQGDACSLTVQTYTHREHNQWSVKGEKSFSLGSTTKSYTPQFVFNIVPATYEQSRPKWELGDLMAMSRYSENSALQQTSLVKNTSPLALVEFGATTHDTTFLNEVTGKLVVDGVSYDSCSKTFLQPGATCHWTLRVNMSDRNKVVAGPFSTKATLATYNKQGNLTRDISANILPGKLEVIEAPGPYEAYLSGTTSETKTYVLKNTGTGMVRWTYTAGQPNYNGILNAVSTAPAGDLSIFRVWEPKSSTWQNTQSSAGSTHKAADSDPALHCLSYAGLMPGAQCSVPISMYTTGGTRSINGQLSLGTSSPVFDNLVLPLTANVLAGNVTYSATEFVFPTNMKPQSTYRSQIVVGNSGATALRLTGIAALADAAPTFILEHNCPTRLEPGDECVLEAVLTPNSNQDWSTASPKLYVTLTHNTNGRSANSTFYVKGKSGGARVTVTPEEFDLGAIERVEVTPAYKLMEITLTSVGDAPVVLGKPRSENPFVLRLDGTCKAGLTLNPGESCTASLQTGPRYPSGVNSASTAHRYRSYLFDMEGDHVSVSAPTKVLASNTFAFHTTARAVDGMGTIVSYPKVVPANRTLPVTFQNDNFRAGLSATVEGAERVSEASPTLKDMRGGAVLAMEHEVQAGPVRSVPSVFLNKGAAMPVTTFVPAQGHNVHLPGETSSKVSSTTTTEPVTNSPASFTLVNALPGGGATYIYTAGSNASQYLVSVNYKGQITASHKIPSAEPTVAGYTAVGTPKVEPVGLSSYKVTYLQVYGAYFNSYSLVYPITRLVDFTFHISDSGVVSNVTTNKITSPTQFGKQSNVAGIAAGGNSSYASEDEWFTLGSWSRVNGSYNYSHVLTGKFGGKSFTNLELPLINATATSPATGLLVDGFLYVRFNGSIYVYNPNKMSSPQRYSYADVLHKGDLNMVFNKDSRSIITSCYSGNAICSIPVFEGSLGVAVVEAGNSTKSGYNDGAQEVATLSAGNLHAVTEAGDVVGFDNLTGPKSVRVAKLSDLPRYGSVGMDKAQYEVPVTSLGGVQQFEVVLKNSSATPLNVLGISLAGATFTTNCLAVPYDRTCTVSIQLPSSVVAAADSGSFTLTTDTSIRPVVAWNKVAIRTGVLLGADGVRSYGTGAHPTTCLGYLIEELGVPYAGDTGSGVYRIDTALGPSTVYCDMETVGSNG